MSSLRLFRLLLVLVLLAGCRSERVEFEFQPTPVAKPQPPVNSHLHPGNTTVAVELSRSMSLQQGSTPSPSPSEILPQDNPRQWKKRPLRAIYSQKALAGSEKKSVVQRAHNQMSDKGIGIAIMAAGILLIIGGIILGILLGGWSGLGVAVLLIALGCFTGFLGHFFLSYFVRHS